MRQWGRLTGTLMPSEGFETGDRAVCLQWLLMPILTHAYIPCICSTLMGRGKICLLLAYVQLNKYERWSDGAMSGLSVPRAVSSSRTWPPGCGTVWLAHHSLTHTHTGQLALISSPLQTFWLHTEWCPHETAQGLQRPELDLSLSVTKSGSKGHSWSLPAPARGVCLYSLQVENEAPQ